MFNDNVLEEIKNLVNDELLVIQRSSPPKYLLPFLQPEDEIIFVRRQREPSNSLVAVKHPFSDETMEELDLTGQPLECPFELEETNITLSMTKERREEDDHCPLDLKNAKSILSSVSLSDAAILPVFVLTDKSDTNHKILLGMTRNDGWSTRCWVTMEEFSRDPTRITCVQDMIQNHNDLSLINPRHTKSEVSCKYVIESLPNCHTTFLRESPGHVEMSLTWKTPSFEIPLSEAAVKITVECDVSNENNEILELWNQLILLYKYLEIIKAWKAERSIQTPYSRHSIEFPNTKQLGVRDEKINASRDLVKLLLEPNQVTSTSLTGRNSNLDKQSIEEIVRRIVSEKKEQEFTDRLWNFLIECDSYQEVHSCFEVVYRYVRTGKSKPYIKTTNISRLARALQCSASDASHFEMILEPLELLIEIGIEKLKKEYISVYLLTKIATSEQLCIPSLPKFPEVNANDWVDSCSSWIKWLMRIHTVLQLVLTAENIVKSKTCIMSLTTFTLEHYLGPNSPIEPLVNPTSVTVQSFTTSINTRDVLDLLNRKTPFNSWTLKLYSEVENRQVTSIFHRNVDDIFPSSLALGIDELEAIDNATFTSNIFTYHCYDYHSVSDKFE